MAREETYVTSLNKAKGMICHHPFVLNKWGPKFPSLWPREEDFSSLVGSVKKGKRGEKKFCPWFQFSSSKTGRKESEGEERKKRERREEKRRNKATNLGLFVSKGSPSVCMVFWLFLMVEWLDFSMCYVQIFSWVDDEIVRLILYSEYLMHLVLVWSFWMVELNFIEHVYMMLVLLDDLGWTCCGWWI